ncbi:hypothetical protein ACJRO0_10000 [Acetobacter oryzifermentans]|uniref:hypothetical protein n=1 Tax=Acetobacter oryzifermentans TaxID=1633874 RepID=UPI0039BED322
MTQPLPIVGYINPLVADALRDPTSGINTVQLRAEPNAGVSGAVVMKADADQEIASLRRALEKSLEALVRVTHERSTAYQARNGKWVSIQGEDGERCDIIHSDITTDCEAAIEFANAALKGPEA